MYCCTRASYCRFSQYCIAVSDLVITPKSIINSCIAAKKQKLTICLLSYDEKNEILHDESEI